MDELSPRRKTSGSQRGVVMETTVICYRTTLQQYCQADNRTEDLKSKSEPCVTFRNTTVCFTVRDVTPRPTPKLGDNVLSALCDSYSYIHSYPPYLEAVSSIHNLRTRHVMVTTDPLNMVLIPIYSQIPSTFTNFHGVSLHNVRIFTELHRLAPLAY
jgi:hypothetical protein